MLLVRRAKRHTNFGMKPSAASTVVLCGFESHLVRFDTGESHCRETLFAWLADWKTDARIRVDSAVRDRLRVLAREQGLPVSELIAGLAASIPTQEERDERQAKTVAYVRRHFCPDMSDADLDDEQLWQAFEAKTAVAQARE